MKNFGTEHLALRRVLSLPWLVFYGVGVTIGAGIFALIAEIVALSADWAPLAFLVAGAVAGFTGMSYAILAKAYPRAAGEVVFVKHGLGEWPGRAVGFGIVAVATTSIAVIGQAFSRYVETLAGMNETASFIVILLVLGAIAMAGVRESVGFAAAVTVLEVGALVAVIAVGLPPALQSGMFERMTVLPAGWPQWEGIFAGAFVAFFAFIGFEDVENMAEETIDAPRAVPAAILLTLVISVVIYALVAFVAAAYPGREALMASKAPLADLFAGVTGRSGAAIAIVASIAMVNGILIQIVMASRVIYGMSREGMVPAALGRIHPTRQTPAIAVAAVVTVAAALGVGLPFLQLAELTSLFILLVFAAVNLSLYLIGRRRGADAGLARWRHWGLAGCALSLGLIAAEMLS